MSTYVSWHDVNCRVFLLKISIVNSGTCPAEDVDVFMHFPDGFALSGLSSFPRKPQEPQPPAQPVPRTRKDRLSLTMPSLNMPAIPVLYPKIEPNGVLPPNISSPDISRSNSYDVKLHVRKLKQNTLEGFDPMIIIFDSLDQISSFQIDYRLVAANVPTAVTGKLHVIFSTDSED